MKYLVRMSNSITGEILDFIRKLNMKVCYESKLLPLVIIECDNIKELEKMEFVEYIEPDSEGTIASFDNLAIVPKIDFNSFKLKSDYKNVKVAIIDTGVDNQGYNIIKSIDYTNTQLNAEKHGTKVAEIMEKVVPNIKLLVAKVSNDGIIKKSDAISALEWAYTNGANVINMSMGFPRISNDIECKCNICELVNILKQEGVAVVVAAGNNGPIIGSITCPGNSESAITVGFINYNNHIDDRSSRGMIGQHKPDLVTSGYISLTYRGQKELEAGSSFATPVITGIVSGIFNKYKNIDKIREVLFSCTQKMGMVYNIEGNGKFDINKLEEVLKNEWIASENR